MVNSEVKDTLQDIEKWSKAYEILEEFAHKRCECECEECGFNSYCGKAMLLIDK